MNVLSQNKCGMTRRACVLKPLGCSGIDEEKERDEREGGMNQVRERRVQRGNIYDYLPCVYAAILGVYSEMSVVLSSPLIKGRFLFLFFFSAVGPHCVDTGICTQTAGS